MEKIVPGVQIMGHPQIRGSIGQASGDGAGVSSQEIAEMASLEMWKRTFM